MLKNYPFTDLKLCDIINHNLMTMINNKIKTTTLSKLTVNRIDYVEMITTIHLLSELKERE